MHLPQKVVERIDDMIQERDWTQAFAFSKYSINTRFFDDDDGSGGDNSDNNDY